MKSCEQNIFCNNLFEKGDKVGVGCSGGSDSIALLHFLAKNQEKFGIEISVIHVDHKIRENSEKDCEFVKEFAQSQGLNFYEFKVDVPKLAKEEGQSLETCAREARYKVFDALIERRVVNKIALAHHKNDQAETILMHIFRGSGLAGAKGMEAVNGHYVRPLLDTSKEEIFSYLKKNKLKFVEDYTNADNNYSRNYLRNVIMKDIVSKWPGAIDSIVNFGKSASEDDEYINNQIFQDAVLFEENLAKIPTSYFVYSQSIIARIVFKALKGLGVNKDIERKHIALISKLALNGDNGNKLSLPFGFVAVKEYDYLTIHKTMSLDENFQRAFKSGEYEFTGWGRLIVKKVRKGELRIDDKNSLFIDYAKLPKESVWRFRKEGDVFCKFGGGIKKLKNFLIDKKVPARLRDSLPVLACGNEIYVVGGIEISDKVKLDENSKNIYQISMIVKD